MSGKEPRPEAFPELRLAEGLDPGMEPGELLQHCREVLEALFEETGIRLRLSLYLCGDEEMSRLHETWRATRGPADVLSFDLACTGEEWEAEGEVVISLDSAKSSALEHGNSWLSELSLCLLHGTLHLMGYEDGDSESLFRMKGKEKKVLDRMGLRIRGRFEEEEEP